MSIFNAADILLPQNADLQKWAVVACDQFTSEPEYWEAVKRFANDEPTTLNVIFPEVYLEDGEGNERIAKINKTMDEYITSGILKEYKNTMIYVEREQTDSKTRKGIVGTVDLEEYDFNKGSQSKIRATEGTILSRIPPRQKIRINAPMELPHILMLIDDRTRSIVEPLTDKKSAFEKLYDFDLMQNSGHITGYKIDEESIQDILRKMEKLEDKAEFETKYGVKDKGVLVIAAGDGNHSLATAKSCWEEIKKGLTEEEKKTHPARFALVELMNIHDEALEFEPIQRVLFDVEPEKLMSDFMNYYDEISYEDNGGQKIRYTYKDKSGAVYVKNAPSNLSVGTLQKFLDEYLEKNGGSIDYIHGDDVVCALSKEDGRIGFMVDRMEKNDLFTTVIKDGALPRKTFSMGNAADKRFYLECRKIK